MLKGINVEMPILNTTLRQGLVTEVWQRRKRQTSSQGAKNLQFLSGCNF